MNVEGPMYAIVSEAKSGAGGYGDMPYFEGCRVDAVQEGAGDNVVHFKDLSDKVCELSTVAEYLEVLSNLQSIAIVHTRPPPSKRNQYAQQTAPDRPLAGRCCRC